MTTIKIPIVISPTDENKTVRELVRNMYEERGPYFILAKKLSTKKTSIPAGTTVKVGYGGNKGLTSFTAEAIHANYINKQEEIIKNELQVNKGSNNFQTVLNAMKTIAIKNSMSNKTNLNQKEVHSLTQEVLKEFTKLDELTNYLVSFNFITGGSSFCAIDGHIANMKWYDKERWEEVSFQQFGKGDEMFYVQLRATLSEGFGRENLTVASTEFFTELYLQKDYSLFKTELAPVMYTVGKLAKELDLSYSFFEKGGNIEKIIANEAPIKLRTFGNEEPVAEKLETFVKKVTWLRKGITQATEEIRKEKQQQASTIAQKYFHPEQLYK